MKVRKKKKDEKEFLTGDPRKDFPMDKIKMEYVGWGMKCGKTTPENMAYFRRLAAGEKFDHPACDYWDQVEYERQHPGMHHSDDLLGFYEWLKKWRKSGGVSAKKEREKYERGGGN